jgi:insulysin
MEVVVGSKKNGNAVGLIVLVLIFVFSIQAEARVRETRTLTLGNGLSVWLIHDSESNRSAAALSVGVGSLSNPDEKLGLAHYLEHMLFLGTKKFPEIGTFKKYLNQNSGRSNAYTSSNETNYFFQSSHESFGGALDRFSDFFKAPLFDQKYAEREVNAVSSEHDKNKLSDGWRKGQVIGLTAEEGHPLRRFSTGNKETLSGDNRDHLFAFYKKYYSASNMKLAMISNVPLSEMEILAKRYFSQVPGFDVNKPLVDSNYRRPLNGKYRLLKIKTIKDTRSLELEFPTIRLKDSQDNKPSSVISSIIGHEGKGSLLSTMKEEGLVLGLSAGGGFSHPSINQFSVSVSLTKKGEAHYERVMELVFAYIKMLKESGVKEYNFKEDQTMAQINFDWKDPQEGMGFVSSRASLMQNFPLKNIEKTPFLFKEFDFVNYKKILDTLTPENMLATLSTRLVHTDKMEKYYAAEYSLTEVGGESFAKLSNPPQVPGMFYPRKNDFIPHNLNLVEEEPHLVIDDEISKVWFQYDNRFKQPKAYMSLRIETPMVYDTPQNFAKSKLYDAAIQEGLNESVYPIQLAGLSYALSVVKKGVNFTVGGYSERISDLIKLVAKNMKEVKIDEVKFGNLKEAMMRSLRNAKLGQAYGRGGYYHRLFWNKKQFTEEQMLEALQPLTLSDIKEYSNKLYEKVFITGAAHGNWTDQDVKDGVNVLLEQIKSLPLPEAERFKQEIKVLGSGKDVRFSKKIKDSNNSMSYTLQLGEYNLENQAKASLIAAIVESDFYLQMRTNQQLGYIVWSFEQRMEDRLFLRFVIQSATYGPVELAKRAEDWFKTSGDLFDNLSDETFENHRKSLIVSLEKKGNSIAEVAGKIFYLATEEKGNFKMKKQLVEVVRKIKKGDVVAGAKQFLQDSSTPRIAVLMRSRDNGKEVSPGVLETISDLRTAN